MDCPNHGTKQVKMPWTREGIRLTLLFEQAAMTAESATTRFWRVVQLYVAQALSKMDLVEEGARPWLGTKTPPNGATTTSPSS
ncbi:hypothetical protein DFAR_3340012 [Desulfarculales bacterium]